MFGFWVKKVVLALIENKRVDNKLEKLKKQKEAIQARIKKREASKALKKRKQEKHLKFLIGKYYLNEAIQTGKVEELKRKLIGTLKRESDKALLKDG